MSNKVSVSAFESIYNFNRYSTQTRRFPNDEGGDTEVRIKYSLSLEESIAFVNEVVDECIDFDDEYYPEYCQYMIKRCILTYYANFNMPKTHKKAYAWIYETSICNDVRSCINEEQLGELITAIHKKIEFKKQTILSNERAALHRASEELSNLASSMSAMYEGVDVNQFVRGIAALSDRINSLPEDKLVSNLVDAIHSTEESEAV